MRRVPAAMLASLFCAFLFAATAVATRAQSNCAAVNAGRGEGKFTGQISSSPNGSSMEVTYGNQTVLVRYSTSVTVCQGGQPTSVGALTRGASVAVFGRLRRNGQMIEIDAARIFLAGPPRMARPPTFQPRPGAAPLRPLSNSQGTQPQPPRQLPPLELRPLAGQRSLSNSVILRGATYSATMQTLHVVRTYLLPGLRTSPQVALGAARLDFRPMLNNPKALFNVAQRLQQIPQHVQVLRERSEISEVDQGLVIHQTLAYRILPGKCADGDARAQLARAGIRCFTRASVDQRLAEFNTPGSPRYVANQEKRQAAISAFQRNSALADADASKGIATLKKELADPQQRAAIVAQVGQAEAARMDGLSDDQLKDEMINSGVQQFEETMFVPKIESGNYAHPPHLLTISPSPGEMQAAERLLQQGVPANGGPSNYPKLLKVYPASALNHFANSAAPVGNKAADLNLGPYIFLTGFTVGHDYEWSWGAQITVNWCLVGCSSTYGLELYAGFNYGFGLRFPIRTQFQYHILVHPNHSAEAKLTANFEPIRGTVNDFFAAGIPADQLYDGKELVAQVGAHAGFNISLPGFGVGKDFPVGVDFTNMLPSPYTGGSFTPPAPGSGGINSQITFNQIDLLGGLLNYGVAGGQLFPSVQINLHSDKLQFTLNDEILRRQTRLTANPQTVSLGVESGTAGNDSHFSIGNPVYNLGFTLTPGLTPNVFVNIDIWSDNWDWTVWFPQLSVDLPPNGVDFGCHAGTTCVVDFQPTYNASTGQLGDTRKERDAADRTLLGGGCQRVHNREGDYLCPVKGMLGLCKAMLSNGAVSSCGALVPTVVDQILKRGHCTDGNGAYVCPQGMMGLCNLYVKNQEILSCTRK